MTRDLLVELVLGDVEPAVAAAALEHLRSNAADAAFVAELRTVIETMESDDTALAPPSVKASAKALFAPAPASVVAEWIAGLRRVAATLTLDTRGQVAHAGFRGGAGTSQLRYTAEDRTIELMLTRPPPDGHRWGILGRIEGTATGNASVALMRGDFPSLELVAQSTADDSGGFSIQAPPGEYTLLIAVGGSLVTIHGMRVE